jgi:Ni,Fe-hydrogenase I large subunit
VCWSALVGLTTTRQKSHYSAYKSVNFDHAIMKVGLFSSSMIAKSHHSNKPGQNLAHGQSFSNQTKLNCYFMGIMVFQI